MDDDHLGVNLMAILTFECLTLNKCLFKQTNKNITLQNWQYTSPDTVLIPSRITSKAETSFCMAQITNVGD